MQMISLWQPFASLIFTLPPLKNFETRSFPFPKRLTGERIAIHATAKFTPHDQISIRLHQLCMSEFGPGYLDTLSRSAIIGTVRLEYCIQTDQLSSLNLNQTDFVCGDWTPGRYAWRLCEPHAFPVPIPQKGGQGWRKIEWL